jgi:PAS domain S-box-containing protein
MTLSINKGYLYNEIEEELRQIMKDERKTKKDLIAELNEMRSLVKDLSEVQDVVVSERRKRQEKQLKFLQNAVDNVADSIIVVGTDFRVKLMNKAARQNSLHVSNRLDDENLCYKMFFGQNEPCDGKGYSCPLIGVLESGEEVQVEQEREISDGVKRIFEIKASPLMSEDDEFLGIVESVRDITERKQSAAIMQDHHDRLGKLVQERTAELLEAKEQAELLYRVCPTAVFSVDRNGKATNWNDMAEQLTGYTRDEIIGSDCRTFFGGDDDGSCCIKKGEDIQRCESMERKIILKSGEIRNISLNFNKLVSLDGTIRGGIGSFVDITNQKRTDEILRSERDKFKSMLTAMGQGVHIVNKKYEIEFQNDVLQDIFGNKIGEKCYEVYKQRNSPCDVCQMHSAISSNSIRRSGEISLSGRYYEQCYAPFIDVDGAPKALILLRDITEQKLVEAETMRAAQLASIGELAAGVAHEINNPINGIINYAQLLEDDAEDNSEGVELLKRIIKEGERVAVIVKNLLFFARQREEEAEEINVDTVIEDSLALIKHQFKKDGIVLEEDIPPSLAMIHVNPQQLQQVFLNLFSNARHALNQRYNGGDPNKKLSIRCSEIQREGKAYVRAEVTDLGTGIPENIIGNIFDPFFSSKEPGKGTGLGLSISHGLIRDFEGFLGVDSTLGEKTTFTVDLPVVKAQEN